jgi:hypothetical protein
VTPAPRSREISAFQAGSATCSAIAARYWATIRDDASSQSTITLRHAGSMNISHRQLRSSLGSEVTSGKPLAQMRLNAIRS